MAHLSRDDIIKIAHLARLRLTEAQVDDYRVELDQILSYVEKLSEVDTESVQPTIQVNGLKNVTQPDQVTDSQCTREELLSNAADQQDGYFKVRRVLS